MNRLKTALAVILVATLSGCSHESWTKAEETTRASSLFNPLLLPVNLMAKAGKALSTPGVVSIPESEDGKRIEFSQETAAAAARDDGDFARVVMTLSARFTQRDFGEVTAEQAAANALLEADGSGAVGRYRVGEKFLIVKDAGDSYKVRYEDEME